MANRTLPGAPLLRRRFVLIVAVLYALIFFTGTDRTPQLGPRPARRHDGHAHRQDARTASAPAQADLELARQIIEQRVNGLGVAERRGGHRGLLEHRHLRARATTATRPASSAQTAQLRFRPVLQARSRRRPRPDQRVGVRLGVRLGRHRRRPSAAGSAASAHAGDRPRRQPRGRADAAAAPTTSAAAADPGARPQRPAGHPGRRRRRSFATLTCAQGASVSTAIDRPERLRRHLLRRTARPSTCSARRSSRAPQVTDASAGTESDHRRVGRQRSTSTPRARDAWAEYTAANVGKQVAVTLDGRVVSAPTDQRRHHRRQHRRSPAASPRRRPPSWPTS